MLERRNSARMPLALKVRETNGDYMYCWSARDISEEGIFLSARVCFSAQDSYSRLSFTLPGGLELHNVTARIVRENRSGSIQGCALEFLNLSEDHRMLLKTFFVALAS